MERPWGSWTVLKEYSKCVKLKELVVSPGQSLSKQSHQYRNELWFIVSGTASLDLNGNTSTYAATDTIDINVGVIHHLTNIGDEELIIIEVQHGTMCVEEDITRH